MNTQIPYTFCHRRPIFQVHILLHKTDFFGKDLLVTVLYLDIRYFFKTKYTHIHELSPAPLRAENHRVSSPSWRCNKYILSLTTVYDNQNPVALITT